jgi:hypothetical protein
MARDDGGCRKESTRSQRWFPFRAAECEIALTVIGLVVGALAAFGVGGERFALSTIGLLVMAYVIGLLVHGASQKHSYRFIEDGGLGGVGYVPFFRAARQSLFVTHADDDVPASELLGLYDRLLSSGVSIRRLIFQRPGDQIEALLGCFGAHPNLGQRIVPNPIASSMPLSFAVVDERVVIISLPGTSGLDSDSYAPKFILRHLLVLTDEQVARVFLKMHERLWALGSIPTKAGAAGH